MGGTLALFSKNRHASKRSVTATCPDLRLAIMTISSVISPSPQKPEIGESFGSLLLYTVARTPCFRASSREPER